jgi:glyoxylase-like metal-dependent hydrolase (beta-lactamase superfamily II)
MKNLIDTPDLLLASMPVGPFAMNEYLLVCRRTGTAALFDGGGDPGPFVAVARGAGAEVSMVLQTHAHIDHVAGLADTRRALPGAPIHLHPLDMPLYQTAPMQGRMFGFACPEPPSPDHELDDGQVVTVGNLRLEVIHTPGHAPGHVIFWERGHDLLIAGDLLFYDSIGRTDLPGADPAAMRTSLARLLELPDTVRVFAGHMQDTRIGRERRHNPVLQMLGLTARG